MGVAAEEDLGPSALPAQDATVFGVILAISFCHLLNDMMQSLLPAIYPNLKATFGLTFGQVGLVTLTYQMTASILQPAVGLYTDLKPKPYFLAISMLFALTGMISLATGVNARQVAAATGGGLTLQAPPRKGARAKAVRR